jgi:hypothetical protein
MSGDRVLGRDGLYDVFRLRAGVAYDGWNLVVTGWTETPGKILTEAMILPLDPGGVFHRVLHQYTDTDAEFALEQHRLTGINILEMLRREGGRGDEDCELVAQPVPSETLKRMWLAALVKPDDDPYRHVYREGLMQLARQTQCRALRAEMRSWMGGEVFGI